jgi:tetratricopeptide (TPR) repeat protein
MEGKVARLEVAAVRWAFVAAAIISTVAAVILARALELPTWAPIAFALSFPAYALILRRLAARALASWEAGLDARARAPGSLAHPLPARSIAAWYYGRGFLLERAAKVLIGAERWTEAASCFTEAVRLAPQIDRPRLARSAWAALRRARAGGRAEALAIVELAMRAPDPPFELFEDHGDIFLDARRFGDADRAYRAAIERTVSAGEGPRCKLYCKLALACAKDGRFGAADGALHEASELLPTGDPGYLSLYDRTAAEIADVKAAHPLKIL